MRELSLWGVIARSVFRISYVNRSYIITGAAHFTVDKNSICLNPVYVHTNVGQIRPWAKPLVKPPPLGQNLPPLNLYMFY